MAEGRRGRGRRATRNTGGETRAARGGREGRKTEEGEEISADADATDSLMAEFPATKFGGHSLAAALLKITAQNKIAQGISRQIFTNMYPSASVRRPSPPAGSHFNVIDPLHSSSSLCSDESNFTRTGTYMYTSISGGRWKTYHYALSRCPMHNHNGTNLCHSKIVNF